jgi:hypothetical protein
MAAPSILGRVWAEPFHRASGLSSFSAARDLSLDRPQWAENVDGAHHVHVVELAVPLPLQPSLRYRA